jgi:hypothetical protein
MVFFFLICTSFFYGLAFAADYKCSFFFYFMNYVDLILVSYFVGFFTTV